MSKTPDLIRARVRFHLRDREKARPAFSSFEYDAVIDSEMRVLAGLIDLGDDWGTGALGITLSNATDTYTAPSTLNYAAVKRLRLASSQREIELVSDEKWRQYRDGIASPQSQPGDPIIAREYENADQQLKFQFHPWPRGADSVEIYRQLMPDALVDDTSMIPFDDAGCEALIYKVAVVLAKKMPEEEFARRGLSPGVIDEWQANIRTLLNTHRTRRARQRARKKIRRGGRGY